MASKEELAGELTVPTSSRQIPIARMIAMSSLNGGSSVPLPPGIYDEASDSSSSSSDDETHKKSDNWVRNPFRKFKIVDDTGESVDGKKKKAKYTVEARGVEMRKSGNKWELRSGFIGAFVQIVTAGQSSSGKITDDDIKTARLYSLDEKMPRGYRIQVRVTSEDGKFTQMFDLIPKWQSFNKKGGDDKKTRPTLSPLHEKPVDGSSRLVYHPYFPPGSPKKFFITQDKGDVDPKTGASTKHTVRLALNNNATK